MITALHLQVAESPSLAPGTRYKYLRDLDRWIVFAGAEPSGWTRVRAQEFYTHLCKTMRPQSANRIMASLAFASKWWSHQLARPDLDFALVQKGRHEDKLVKRALLWDEAERLLDTCGDLRSDPRDARDFGFIVLALETGMRIMSLMSTRIEGLHAEPTAKHPYPHVFALEKGSGRSQRGIPVSDTALAALGPWRAALAADRRQKGPLFLPIVSGLGMALNLGDSALTASSIKKMLNRRSAAAKLPHLNPHMFRHTFVTWRSQMKIQPHEIAAISGHTVGLGALEGYLDATVIAETARAATPPQFATYVTRRLA